MARRECEKDGRMRPAIFALLMLVGLAGCLPVSQNPLSSPEDAAADSRLPGVWYGRSGEDTIYLHFVAGKGAQMDAVEVDHQKDGDAHTNIYTVFPSVLGAGHYLNIREKAGAEKPYYFARYRIADSGALTIWLMGETPAAKAVKNKKIAGKITTKDSGGGKAERDITLTASSEELAAFVRKSDPEILFGEKFGTFKKLVLPSLDDTGTPAHSGKRKKKSSEE